MAGGSADAAAALVACAALWQIDVTKVELAELAAQLGSDVPFALHGGTALGVGRGEQVNPVLATGRFWWVLALADIEISARTAYAELDRLRTDGAAPPPLGGPDDVLDALRAGDPHLLAPLLGNDLQAAALSLAPRLRRTLRTGAELGALAGIVSGSGPTCAFLCADAEAATDLVAALSAEDVCRTVRLASGPVLGTRVIG
jgi:4-diphosphocytidyl-2-C-methyl-D-erythritol kinase